MLFFCNTCGHTFTAEVAYDSHRVKTTDGRVKIVPASKERARWFMESPEGPGGQGFVTTSPLRERCLSQHEMDSIRTPYWGSAF